MESAVFELVSWCETSQQSGALSTAMIVQEQDIHTNSTSCSSPPPSVGPASDPPSSLVPARVVAAHAAAAACVVLAAAVGGLISEAALFGVVAGTIRSFIL